MGRKGCMACKEAEKRSFVAMQYKDSDLQLIMEMAEDGMRMHLTDGQHHRTQRMFFCPFCGKRFED